MEERYAVDAVKYFLLFQSCYKRKRPHLHPVDEIPLKRVHNTAVVHSEHGAAVRTRSNNGRVLQKTREAAVAFVPL